MTPFERSIFLGHAPVGLMPAMDIFYINLAEQTERQRKLESNFQANNASQWVLHRIDAVSAQAVANKIPGRLRDGEKACFQSHIKAIETAKQSAGHVLIAEDDILFGNCSSAISSLLMKTRLFGARRRTIWPVIRLPTPETRLPSSSSTTRSRRSSRMRAP